MPAKPHNPNHVTVYLDQSHWSSAYSSIAHGSGGPSGSYARLYSWLCDVPDHVDLCISLAHIVELSCWTSEREAMAAWLERLPLVWMRLVEALRRAEVEYSLLSELCGDAARVEFTEPSMLRAIGLSLEPAAEARASPTIERLVTAVSPALVDEYRARVVKSADDIRIDREQWLGDGKYREHGAAELDDKFRCELRMLAFETHERLKSCAATNYAALGPSVDSDLSTIVRIWETNPRALPLLRIEHAFFAGFASAAEMRAPGSNRYNGLRSSGFDAWHAATGGAYCDIFTCDSEVARWIGPTREALGLSAPLISAGLPAEEFVEKIISAAG